MKKEEWEKSTTLLSPLTDEDRLGLALEIFDLVYHNVDDFRSENIGVDLAYLLGAIVDRIEGTAVVDWSAEAEAPALLLLLERLVPADHRVWQFILT